VIKISDALPIESKTRIAPMMRSQPMGTTISPSPDALVAQMSRGLDLKEVNGDGTATLPMPTTLIVDGDHALRWVDVHPDYTTRSEPEEILPALEALR
jgi:hypothetical protein